MKISKKFLLTDLLYLKVFIAFGLGILSAEFLSFSIAFAIPIVSILILLITYKILQISRSKVSDTIVFSMIILSGIVFHSFQLVREKKSIQSLDPVLDKKCFHFIRLDEKPLRKSKTIRLEGTLLQSKFDTNTYTFSQKIIVYLPLNQKIDSVYDYGKIYQIQGPLEVPTSPRYDFEFDYKQWLSRRGVFATIYSKEFTEVGHDTSWIYYLKTIPIRIRDYYEREIDCYITEPTSNDIAKSLLIGIRTDIDKTLYNAYSDTGTIHILSVSGLHFGILILFLEYVLSLFIKKEKVRVPIKHSFSFIYALMTGFSPPVMRSFLMFIFIDIEKIAKMKTSTFNILFLSAWIILLFDTNQMFDIGFQLSYAAMLGIMILYPRMIWKLEFDNTIANFTWKSTVTMFSAWLFTAPFTIYYFHKVSFIGMLSNFLILPIATTTMYLGFVLLIFSKIQFLATIVGAILSYLIYIQNQIILWFSQLPLSSISQLYLNTNTFIVSLFSIVFLVIFLQIKDKLSFRLFLLSILILLGLNSFETYKIQSQNKWYIIPSRKFPSFAYKSMNEIHVFSDSIELSTKTNFIENLKIRCHINSVYYHGAYSYFKHLPMEYSPNDKVSPHYFVVCNSNKTNWNQAISSRDTFIIMQDIPRWERDELIQKLKGKNHYYIVN